MKTMFTEIVPQPQSTNVALNTPVVFVLKDEDAANAKIEAMLEVTYVTTTQELQQYPPVDKTEIVRCEGISS
jgi:hypothetical protein